jgi:SAM-dependent methyltransferase
VEPLGIRYLQQDLSTFEDAGLGFDVVVANMVFQNIPDYRPAMQHCVAATRSGGHFIFSLPHPCFDEVDRPDVPRGYAAKGHIRVEEYLREFVTQQRVGFNIHRPLSAYLNAVIDDGCAIERVVEPTLSAEGVAALGADERNLRVPSFLVISAQKRAP